MFELCFPLCYWGQSSVWFYKYISVTTVKEGNFCLLPILGPYSSLKNYHMKDKPTGCAAELAWLCGFSELTLCSIYIYMIRPHYNRDSLSPIFHQLLLVSAFFLPPASALKTGRESKSQKEKVSRRMFMFIAGLITARSQWGEQKL